MQLANLDGDASAGHSAITDETLRKFNIRAGVLHLCQGLLMLVASQAVASIKEFKKEVTTSFLAYDDVSRSLISRSKNVGSVEIGESPPAIPHMPARGRSRSMVALSHTPVQPSHRWHIEHCVSGVIAAVFLLMSALAHALVVIFFEKYLHDINRGVNRARWWEYAASSSLMITAIAMLFGVYDLSTLILIGMINACMNL